MTESIVNLENCIFERRGPLAIVTLNRPQHLNAISSSTHREVSALWDEINRNPEIRVAIVTGTGDRAFCAGKDVKEYAAIYAAGAIRSQDDPTSPDYRRLANRYVVRKPLIGALNGLAVGAGLDMFRMADIRIMADHAKVSALGEQIDLPSGVHLADEIPFAVASMVTMTGEWLTAQRCLALGLVSEVVPLADLMPRALAVADRILQMGPDAIMQIKQRNLQRQLEWGLVWEIDEERKRLQGIDLRPSENVLEGHLAFAEKRAPTYREDVAPAGSVR